MVFRSLKLTNYKCYDTASVTFHPQVNCLVGNNGAGKTNLMDALYYCCFTKSYFSSGDQLVFRQGSDFFRLEAIIGSEEGDRQIVIKARDKEKKLIEVNGSPVGRLSDFIGRFNAVMIAPDDNQLILGGSEGRRKFMDGCIGQYDAAYLQNLIGYQNLLRQRNALLKQGGSGGRLDTVLLDTLDDRLAGLGSSLFESRKVFMVEYEPVFLENFKVISGGIEEAGISYESQLFSSELADLFKQSRDQDIMLGRTTNGLHRDDLVFSIFGRPLKHTGSQGQQKSFLAALKLGQFEIIETHVKAKPFLFLDDLMDKFDSLRIEHMIDLISKGRFGQVFITDTHEERLVAILKKHNLAFRLLRVADAQVSE